MKTATTALLLLTGLLFPLLSGAQIVNGSFEPTGGIGSYLALPGGSAAIPGWTTTDTGVEWFDPAAFGYAPAPSGSYVVDIANYTFSAGGIMQTIPTVPGQIYTIYFNLGTHRASGRDGTCEITVTADGQDQTYSMTNTGSQILFLPMSYSFSADDTGATLSFRCLQNANYHFAYLDGIAAAGPVPSTGTALGTVKSLFR